MICSTAHNNSPGDTVDLDNAQLLRLYYVTNSTYGLRTIICSTTLGNSPDLC